MKSKHSKIESPCIEPLRAEREIQLGFSSLSYGERSALEADGIARRSERLEIENRAHAELIRNSTYGSWSWML